MIKVGRTVVGHAIRMREDELRGNVPDRGRDRRDGSFSQILESAIPSEYKHRTSLVRSVEPIPSNFAPSHLSVPRLLIMPNVKLARAYGLLPVAFSVLALKL